MKSLKFTLALLIISSLLQSVSGQLSGIYTIGGTTPDYATIPAAVTALQSLGVSAAVTFNIRPGTYTGKIDMTTVPGVSATNTVTFKSENNDSTSVILEDSASATNSNYLWHIFGTDFLTIRNITLRRFGPSEKCSIFSIALNSRYLQIRNCILEANSTAGFDEQGALIYFPLGGLNDSSITFSNNVMNGGTYGIYMIGQNTSSLIPLTQINDNNFTDQNVSAMQLRFSSSPSIQRNHISTITNDFGFVAIDITDSRNNIKIIANTITGIQNSGDCILLRTCTGTGSSKIVVANNFMQTQGSGGTGINIISCSHVNIYYNTANITSTGTFDAAIYIDNTVNDSILNIKNNIFVNTGGGLTVYLSDSISGVSIVSSDYNDLWVSQPNTNFAFVKGALTVDFAGYKTATGMDSHSVSGDPQFISTTNLHVGNPLLNDAGVFVAGVTTDIDGQTRSNSTPDIGADEFVPLNNNIALLGFISPISGVCGDSSTFFGIVIRNYGLNTQTTFPMHLELSGMQTQSITQNYSGSIATNTNDTVVFSQSVITYAGGTLDVTAYLSLTNDQDRLNDTVHTTFLFAGHPNAPTIVSPQSQCDNNIQIFGSPDSGTTLAWYADAAGGDPLFIGNPFTPVITTDSTFYVEARGADGGCLRITEFEPDDNPSDFVEIENISGFGFDATGWKVITNSNNDDPDPMTTVWNLGYFGPGEAQYQTDNASDHYWGANLNWSGGAGSYILVVDNDSNVVDYIIWDWDTLFSPYPTIITFDGINYNVADHWSGPPIQSCTGTGTTQRLGTQDNDNASDWNCNSVTKGFHNPSLASVFTNCSVGKCGSVRVPVDVTLVPGVTVNLGNDTLVGQPFFIDLDAGPGFTSYLWSTGHTVQSITVSTYDTYWVTVTGGPNNCTYTDSITISLNVGVNDPISSEEIILYPNPSSDIITVAGRTNILKSAIVRVTDIDGRFVDVPGLDSRSGEMSLDIRNLTPGIYFLHISSGNRTGVKRFAVIE